MGLGFGHGVAVFVVSAVGNRPAGKFYLAILNEDGVVFGWVGVPESGEGIRREWEEVA